MYATRSRKSSSDQSASAPDGACAAKTATSVMSWLVPSEPDEDEEDEDLEDEPVPLSVRMRMVSCTCQRFAGQEQQQQEVRHEMHLIRLSLKDTHTRH